uniref:Uncharacterized protein n=1 Tax=Schistocephalus solidus TaxID=70667 RepID=A0A0X3NLZ3_SCHSO
MRMREVQAVPASMPVCDNMETTNAGIERRAINDGLHRRKRKILTLVRTTTLALILTLMVTSINTCDLTLALDQIVQEICARSRNKVPRCNAPGIQLNRLNGVSTFHASLSSHLLQLNMSVVRDRDACGTRTWVVRAHFRRSRP